MISMNLTVIVIMLIIVVVIVMVVVMSRPRIPVGGCGEIAFIQRAKGKVEARTRFRDWDGQTRLVQATATSRSAAEVELKRRLAERRAGDPVQLRA